MLKRTHSSDIDDLQATRAESICLIDRVSFLRESLISIRRSSQISTEIMINIRGPLLLGSAINAANNMLWHFTDQLVR
ncbi:hypothetical protein BOSE62_70724 [Bosea sp. 62]|nr:hypothetical protein BOSE7B_50565 [Bosea sp. 7B]CAD5298961.1 hypothetical protein BOSE21B_90929 [Bosea sp. 21B]CAD5299113.1 hypothetical protein BOSE46_81001 [Bosea sp. 46]VVT61576.1 hypothetical protein BOS5A_230853 [Bosea sp. EC-HK365B]VXB09493.1 hypothetical protein BOSE127_100235 [Bosea sp. 127]VXB33875.1 hypothetical protein BOSE125_130524 [Bosea sp. 125]VXC80377.1 hypothetical protein BOSE62_70724 [Bosea sp. 62]VXC86242.1 hypothetical protein BOSE29B_80886 [Bosea sp. 29B]